MKTTRNYWIALGAFAALAAAYLVLQPVAPAPKKLTIAVTRVADSTLVYIAANRSYFRDEGLEVTLQPHEFGKAALDSMLDGKADAATVAETPLVIAAMQGRPLAIIAGIFSSDRNMGIVARRDKGISAPADLAGKRIAAAPGTNGDYFRYAFLAANGVPLNSIEAVGLRPGEMADALQGGQVDAVAVWHPFLRQIEKRMGSSVISFYGESIYTYTFNLAASRRLVTKEQQSVISLLRALKKAEDYALRNPEEALGIVANATGIDREMLKELWGGFTFRLSLEQALLVSMENQARWAIGGRLVPQRSIPNFLDLIYFDGLGTASPETVLITH